MTDQSGTGAAPKGGANGAFLRLVVGLVLATTTATTGESWAMNDTSRPSTAPAPAAAPARDPEFAVREEYDEAVRAGTAEAFQLFINRNPGHRLARRAARRIRALEARAARRGP